MKRTIWTMFRRGFMVLGGPEWIPSSTEVEVLEVRKIKGIEFFSFEMPDGKIKVAEGQTGGIITDSFDTLLADIKGCSKAFLQSQIDNGSLCLKDTVVRKYTPEVFFSTYKH